jgi:cytochrome b subunit of formate dehydrogenase
LKQPPRDPKPGGWRISLTVAVLVASACQVGPLPARAQTDTASCLGCHDDASMRSGDGRPVGIPAGAFKAGIHGGLDCTDCHTAPGNYDDVPHFAKYTPVDCSGCHGDASAAFTGSIHADLFADGGMACATCHAVHDRGPGRTGPLAACGSCHESAAADYATSVHRVGRKRNGEGAATCSSCHGSHHVVAVADTTSPVHPHNIPRLCGDCHARQAPMTEDFVRLPITVPTYLASVHGRGWQEGRRTAVCTDCHGAHDSRLADDPKAHINRHNVAETCAKCHDAIAREYTTSIHGAAVALGVTDSPTCVDCHSEHLIKGHSDPSARVTPEHRARQLCGDCHTNPEIVSKYGIAPGVVESYLDSYHGWAVSRGSDLVATCTDCHTVHAIRSPLDSTSTVHPANVTATCAKCHPGATATFARSYTHAGAQRARGPQGWARYVYLWLIGVVLGGMVLHNAVIAGHEVKRHVAHARREPFIRRWRGAELVQHLVLLFSFTGLALSGFALRFPEAWWVRSIGLGGHEAVRAQLHRGFAILMVAAAVYHTIWLVGTRRGRLSLRELAPAVHDVRQLVENMAYHLGRARQRPAFRMFDYTQKAEYWALVWGTWVMALTGLVLWYPTVATRWLPAWIVRVSEVVHFYEAILAVSAIFIWHFFFVIFLPAVYPMSTTWLDGRMPVREWKEFHAGEYAQAGGGAIETPGEARRPDGPPTGA